MPSSVFDIPIEVSATASCSSARATAFLELFVADVGLEDADDGDFTLDDGRDFSDVRAGGIVSARDELRGVRVDWDDGVVLTSAFLLADAGSRTDLVEPGFAPALGGVFEADAP